MREILFRGKRVDNGELVYGFYSKSTPVFEGVEHSYITPICENGSIDMSRKVIPESVGQFTGLKDANDTDVYESDVLRFSVFDYNGSDTQYKGVVKWSGAKFVIWPDKDHGYFGANGPFDLDWVFEQDDEPEIIGNIHKGGSTND